MREGGDVDWFERLTGFREEDYAPTRAKLRVEEHRLRKLTLIRRAMMSTLSYVDKFDNSEAEAQSGLFGS
jgi:hypothetical protein